MSFRFQSRKVMLTYRTHINKDEYIAWVDKNLWEPSFIRCAHEVGKHDNEADAYPHTHVLIDFGRIRQSTDPRKFDYLGIHPHIKPVSSRTDVHWKNELRYIAKEDHSNDDVAQGVEPPTTIERLWSHETLSEGVVALALKFSEIPGATVAWNMRPSEYIPPPPPAVWRPWQNQVLAELAKPITVDTPDYRKIHWIVDERGSAGKSLLTRVLEDHHGAFAATWGRAIDILWLLAQENSLNNRTLVFDLPRRMEDRDLYSPLEDIANGKFTSTKYQPRLVKFNRGHIVVFANFMPSITGWTHDRYDVWKIVDPERPVVRLTLGADLRWVEN